MFRNINGWRLFKEYIICRNRFVLDDEGTAFVAAIKASARKRCSEIKQGESWYRARNCVEDCSKGRKEGNRTVYGVFPAVKQDIVAPPYQLALEGRANPRMMPVLYLSSDPQTAVAEIRASMAEPVTVAEFAIDRDMTIVNLEAAPFDADKMSSAYQRDIKNELTSEELEQLIWEEIGRDFSAPTSPCDGRGQYVPTQYLASVFSRTGFGGIFYTSSLHPEGRNLVLFDPYSANPRNGRVYSIRSIQYEIVPWKQTRPY